MPPANRPSSPARQAPLGRTPRDKDRRQRKMRPLSIYLDPDEEAAIRRAAADRGNGISEYIRRQALLDIMYGTGNLVEQVQLLASDSSNHSELEYQLRVWVKGLTGVTMAPPVDPPVPKQAPDAAMPPPVQSPSPTPASVEALVPPVDPRAVPKPRQWKQKAGAIALTIVTDLFNVMFGLLAGVWRWLIRCGSRAGDFMARESMYDRLIGRTPLQFLLTAVMLVALPIAAFGRTDVGFYLLDTHTDALTILRHLPDEMQRRHNIGLIVEEMPDNTDRINACRKRQAVSRHNFWCKFEIKAGA